MTAHSQAHATQAEDFGPAPDPIYATRDDIARSLNPANAHERMLVSAIAQAWERFQRACEIERRVFEKTDPVELLDNDLKKFKAVTRHVAECERMYRRAHEELRRAQRDRRAAPEQPERRRPEPTLEVTREAETSPPDHSIRATDRSSHSTIHPVRQEVRELHFP